MDVKMYAIYDDAVSEYLTPFFANSDKQAMQVLRSSLAKESQLVMYPSNYTLWRLGDLDTEQGIVTQGSKSEVSSLAELIPPALKQYALDGTTFGL